MGQSENQVAELSFTVIKDYLCLMKQWQVLRTVFPEIITDNFEFTDYSETPDVL